jgi:hypothetical protein
MNEKDTDNVDHIEFRNETDEPRNVVVCRSMTGQLYIHLLGDSEEIHGDEATTVEPNYYAHAPVNGGKT